MKNHDLYGAALLSLCFTLSACGGTREPTDELYACLTKSGDIAVVSNGLTGVARAHGYRVEENGAQSKEDLTQISNGSSAIPSAEPLNMHVYGKRRVVLMATNFGLDEDEVLISLFRQNDAADSRFGEDVIRALKMSPGVTVRRRVENSDSRCE
jgi:hypothetical protein